MTQIAIRREVLTDSIADHRLRIIQRLRGTIEHQNPDQVHHSLVQVCAELYEMVERLMVENDSIRELVKNKIREESCLITPNLSTTEIKEMILRDIGVGEIFYPSDIANKYGLDLKTVIEVVNNLKDEGRLIAKTNNDVST